MSLFGQNGWLDNFFQTAATGAELGLSVYNSTQSGQPNLALAKGAYTAGASTGAGGASSTPTTFLGFTVKQIVIGLAVLVGIGVGIWLLVRD